MYFSTITQKGQTTIPSEIRHQLNIEAGDKISFEVINGAIVINKLQSFDLEYHQALSHAFSEWKSPEDDEAYADL